MSLVFAACAMLTSERAERIKMANVCIGETLQIFRHTCLSLSQTLDFNLPDMHKSLAGILEW